MNSDELGRLPLYEQADFVNYTGPLPGNNNIWDSALFNVDCDPSFDANLAGHMPTTGSNTEAIRPLPDELPTEFFMNELFYDQMASVFSGWKGQIPELPREQPIIPAPSQYHISQSILPMSEGYDSMPLYT